MDTQKNKTHRTTRSQMNCCLICGEEMYSETRQLCGKYRCYNEDDIKNDD